MKQLLSLIFALVLPLILYSQSSGSVSIKITDSRQVGSSDYYGDYDTLILYKINNGIVIGRALDFYYSDSVFVNNLDTGMYHFSYQNIFGQIIDKLIPVKVGIQSNIRIAIDSLVEYDYNILEHFTEKDTLTLFYITTGCFSRDVKKLTITKDSGFVARIYECDYKYLPKDDFSIQNGTYLAGPLIKEIRMNEKQIVAFIRFENELEAVSYRGCTTTTFYKLIDPNGFIIDREDGSCNWYGYEYLEESLFGFER